MDLANLSSNWKKLQATLRQPSSTQVQTSSPTLKRKRENALPRGRVSEKITNTDKRRRVDGRMNRSSAQESSQSIGLATAATNGHIEPLRNSSLQDSVNAGLSTRYVYMRSTVLQHADESSVDIGRYVAVDCEMVGVGPEPDRDSALARVSIVNYDGEQIYDSYVKPLEEVTDWRTHVSGISPKHMAQARTLREVQTDVCEVLQGRVLVGHAIRHDLEALLLSHPKIDIRDTARHPPYRKLAGGNSPRLKILASEYLGLQIQEGQHSSVEDARACMLLFRRDKAAFEREHAKRWPAPRPPPVAQDGSTSGKSKKPKKKKKKR